MAPSEVSVKLTLRMANVNSFCKLLIYYIILVDFLFGTLIALRINKRLIEKINRMRTTWKAGVNLMKLPRKFEGGPRRKKFSFPFNPVEDKVPKTRFFDARDHWPKCETVLSDIRDQGFCGSSWAVAAASMLSDRLCIQSGGMKQDRFSAHELMTCCEKCLLEGNTPPCEGGDPYSAIEYYFYKGIVTGGEVGSHEGCKPYGRRFYEGFNEKCVKACTNPKYSGTYSDHYGRNEGDFSAYLIPGGEPAIRREIYNKGPVVAQIVLYEDLIYYKTGVYQHSLGKELGVHWVKIIGWGDRHAERYWLVVNSHGTNFGYGGTMRFRRGVNQSGIEEFVIGAYNVFSLDDFVTAPAAREAVNRSSGGNSLQPSRVQFAFVEIISLYLFLCLYN